MPTPLRSPALVSLFLLLPSLLCAQGRAPSHPAAGWAAHAVWYRIVPDRFANGDPMNDPTIDDVLTGPGRGIRRWRTSPWTADWYARQSWESADAPAGGSFDEVVARRRYGGDLQGVLRKFEYLGRLGVNAISFTGLFAAPSLLKDDATLLHHIDKNLGGDPAGDTTTWGRENPAEPSTWKWTAADKLFLKLVKEAHRRKIRIMLDLVADHPGTGFWAFRDVRTYQERSVYLPWFTVHAFDDPATAADEFRYVTADGHGDAPAFRRDSTGLAAGPRSYLAAVVRRWMDPDGDGDPADGVDGWFVEEPAALPAAAWDDLAALVHGLNADGILACRLPAEGPATIGGPFDAVVDPRWERDVVRCFLARDGTLGPAAFARADSASRAAARPLVIRALGGGASGRLATMVVSSDTASRRPTQEESRLARLAVLCQATSAGAPMLLYGDEAGAWGGPGGDLMKPMLWGNFIYDAEAGTPGGGTRRPDPVGADLRLAAYYKVLFALRSSHEALRTGATTTVLADDRRGLYAYLRSSPKDRLLVVLNLSDAEEQVAIPLDAIGGAPPRGELLERNGFNVEGGTVAFLLRPVSGNVFLLGP